MAALSLWDAAEKVGTSKSAIWRAIKEGRLNAMRDDSGNFSVDPNEVMRVLSLHEPARQEPARQESTRQEPARREPAINVEAPDALARAAVNMNFAMDEPDSNRIRVGILQAEIAGLQAVLAEVRLHRDELRVERDAWRGQAEKLMGQPSRWRRLVG